MLVANDMCDPETLVDVAESGAECESLLGVADDAYERATGGELRYHATTQVAEPTGVAWDEETVDTRYPRLVAKFAPYLL